MSSKFYIYILLSLLGFNGHMAYAQVLIQYDQDYPTAKVHYNDFLFGVYANHYKKLSAYPITGAYSSSSYSYKGVKNGRGACNYIYIPTDGQLIPGHQYSIQLTVKVTEAYALWPYYQKHFGLGLSEDLDENHFGLLIHHSVPLGRMASEELVTIEFECRPLCSSKYLLLGVFQGLEMDDHMSDFSQHAFELHALKVEKSKNLNAKFHYICDGFEEDKLAHFENAYETDTIFFESGSAQVHTKYNQLLDSIPSKLRTSQELVTLYAYTDKQGHDNEDLGAARNTTVHQALIDRGINSSRILMVNYGETKSKEKISAFDRRVEIDINLGKVYQKHYTEALQAAAVQDYGQAFKSINNWYRMVPPDQVIYALFDCWGDGEKALRFQRDLLKNIRGKYYRGKELQFTLDSLYCEHQKGRGLETALGLNRLPTEDNQCLYSRDWKDNIEQQKKAEEIYSEYGFPSLAKVGQMANGTLPSIILENDDLRFLEKYLPIIKEACASKQLPWDYYAQLFDKIQVIKSGFQRYGTQIDIASNGQAFRTQPVEDIEMLNEFRKRVKLTALSKIEMKSLQNTHNQIDRPLVEQLNTMYQSDQKLRRQTRQLEDQFGTDSDEIKNHWQLIQHNDSINQVALRSILDSTGWLGHQIIGHHGQQTLFLIIQHATLEMQLKYLPMIRDAVKKGHAKALELAYLEDRVATLQGQGQIYGTQVLKNEATGSYYVAPIFEPEKVDERRAQLGLNPIEFYLKRWNIEWRNPKNK